MHWLVDLLHVESAARAMVILGLVVGTGLALGSVRVFGISLGIAGVLFSGLLAGHLLQRVGIQINLHTLEFARELGLILFVYTIGVQVGPGFFASLRKQGMKLNLLAAAIVVLGALATLGVHWIDRERMPAPAAVGIFAGATTNTPSLAAAQQALKDRGGAAEASAVPGMAYAVSYPFGILGIIITMLGVRAIFRIDPPSEAEALAAQIERDTPRLASMNLEVKNVNLDGLALGQLPMLGDSGIVISRIMSGGVGQVATSLTRLRIGDHVHAVGPREKLDQLRLLVGAESKVDVTEAPGDIMARKVLVTKSDVLGHTVDQLALRERFNVTVTRVSRADIELPPSRTRLQFGDSLVVVGRSSDIAAAARELGDSLKQLNHPQIIPIFIGIALGVIVGSWPIDLGLPAPVKLGLAGGPLIVAILLSRLGNVGPLVWYMPSSASFILRELGIALFLAVVGVVSGGAFWNTLINGNGLYWMAMASLVTLVPILVVALVARMVFKLNYLIVCGLLAGSMTDPPALQFASQMTGSDAPTVSYATVYPLVMLLRILAAQVLVLILLN